MDMYVTVSLFQIPFPCVILNLLLIGGDAARIRADRYKSQQCVMTTIIFIDDSFDPSVLNTADVELNGFGGANTECVQVLKSNAGYYIGSLYKEDTDVYFPNERLSANYWDTREEAKEALRTGNYEPNF